MGFATQCRAEARGMYHPAGNGLTAARGDDGAERVECDDVTTGDRLIQQLSGVLGGPRIGRVGRQEDEAAPADMTGSSAAWKTVRRCVSSRIAWVYRAADMPSQASRDGDGGI